MVWFVKVLHNGEVAAQPKISIKTEPEDKKVTELFDAPFIKSKTSLWARISPSVCRLVVRPVGLFVIIYLKGGKFDFNISIGALGLNSLCDCISIFNVGFLLFEVLCKQKQTLKKKNETTV